MRAQRKLRPARPRGPAEVATPPRPPLARSPAPAPAPARATGPAPLRRARRHAVRSSSVQRAPRPAHPLPVGPRVPARPPRRDWSARVPLRDAVVAIADSCPWRHAGRAGSGGARALRTLRLRRLRRGGASRLSCYGGGGRGGRGPGCGARVGLPQPQQAVCGRQRGSRGRGEGRWEERSGGCGGQRGGRGGCVRGGENPGHEDRGGT